MLTQMLEFLQDNDMGRKVILIYFCNILRFTVYVMAKYCKELSSLKIKHFSFKKDKCPKYIEFLVIKNCYL